MRVGAANHSGLSAVVLVIAALLAVWGCSGDKSEGEGAAGDGTIAENGTKDITESKLPDIALKRLDGETVRMNSFRGKLVVLFFWASWNNDSRELIEIVNAIYPRYSRRYQFCAVSMDREGAPAIRGFVERHPILCDVFVNGGEVARAFNGVGTIPAFLVILRDGRVIKRLDGLHRRKQYEELLTGVLRYRH